MLALNGKQDRFYSDQAPEKLNKLNSIEIFSNVYGAVDLILKSWIFCDNELM